MGGMLAQNPALGGSFGNTSGYSGGSQFITPSYASGGSMPTWNQGMKIYSQGQPSGGAGGLQPYQQGRAGGLGQTGVAMGAANNASQGAGNTGYGGGSSINGVPVSSFAPQGFQYAGQPIRGQLMPNVTQGQPGATTGAGMRYNPYQFFDPGAEFTQRQAFQYGQTPNVNVADFFTPQMDLARRDIEEAGGRQREAILADMNKRGMLTTGAANKSIELQYQEQNRKLSDLASQYSIAQGQAQLQEDQLRRQMDMQRQVEQAAEIFRQQGASDEQAMYLATNNINLQNAQSGANQAAFGANLGAQQQQFGQGLSSAELRLAQQGQQFNQALQGRQAATAEEQLANLMRRQPLEDLFKLYGAQTGQIGATEGSSGFMGVLGSLIGAGANLGSKFIKP